MELSKALKDTGKAVITAFDFNGCWYATKVNGVIKAKYKGTDTTHEDDISESLITCNWWQPWREDGT